jgi:hypothetical protein
MPKKMPLGDLGVENQAVNKFLDLMARLIAQRHMQFAHESSTEAPRRPARVGRKSKSRLEPSTDVSASVDSVPP